MSDTIATAKANDPRIDGLLSGVEWNLGLLTYGFPSTPAQYGGAAYAYDDDGTAPFVADTNEAATASALSADMRIGITRAMTDLAGFTALEVSRLLNASAGAAQLRFAETTTPRAAYVDNTAYANFPNDLKPGDTWFDDGLFDTAPLGTYEYAVGIHELGHLLGLKHGHEAGGPGATALPAAWDSTEFSIMTYASYIGDTTGDDWNHAIGAQPQGWMMLDIRALQHMYGVDYTYNAGNTTYGFSATTGEMRIDGVSQGVPTDNVIFRTIWDGKGVDTYDFSGYGADRQMRIDLRPGDPTSPDIGWTDVDAWDDTDPRPNMPSPFQAAFLGGGPNGGYARGQVANAMLVNGDIRSLIENAIGGAGNDSIIGNQADNLLEGRGGDDVLQGFAGQDTLRGGDGADQHDGGTGFDMVSYADAGQRVTVDLAFDRADGTFGKATFGGVDSGDTFLSIEDIEGSGYDDQLLGWAGLTTRILGGGGNDLIDGRGGTDIIDAGLGNDTVTAHGGDLSLFDGGLTLDPFDVLVVGGNAGVLNWAANSFAIDGQGIVQVLGFEIVQGGIGGDQLTAGSESQSFYGNDGNDTLTGGSGGNVLEGGAGGDLLTFGGGFDYTDYRSDTIGVLVDIRSGVSVSGHAAGDSWVDSPEGILAGAGNDSLGGTDGANRILGRAGNDNISGYGGDDSLEGGDGNENIEGGLGADQLFGDAGDDAIVDTEGLLLPAGADDNANDLLFGGSGNDSLRAGGGADSLDGGSDDDALTGGDGADDLRGGDGNDILSDHTQVAAPGGALLSGGYSALDADTLLAGAGDDLVFSGAGGDLIDGGTGIDNLLMDFTGAIARLAFTMAATGSWTMTLGNVVTATVSNIEVLAITAGSGNDVMTAARARFYVSLDGGVGNDILRGGASGDVLNGSGGRDRLYGNGGDDLLVGGAGADTLAGGAGADLIRWDIASDGKDRIEGFVSNQDRLWIDASGFGGGLAEGMDLAATGRLVFGTAPTLPRVGQFLYDQASGLLQWDVDGTRARAAVTIATLDPGTVLAASDFLIVA